MTTAPLLSVDRLAIGYGRRQVGADISFTVAPGDVLALLGPNGSGKTTLFRTLLGLNASLGGRMIARSQNLDHMSLGERARFLGYVPQAAAAFFPYTVREIVLMGRTPHISVLGGPSPSDREAAAQAIAAIGIDYLADRDITRISGGERQLALIARALAQRPALLVMDEPTASLDFANQLRILDLIRTLAAGGLGIIVSTHHPDQALAIATHAALLAGGRLLSFGPAADVLTAGHLSALFGVALAVETVAGSAICVPARDPQRPAAPDPGRL